MSPMTYSGASCSSTARRRLRSSRGPDSMRCQARALRVAAFLVGGFLNGPMAKAGNEMVIDHADSLHEGVDDGRAAKFEAALRQFLGHRARDRGLGGHLALGAVVVDFRFAVDEIPEELGEARPLVHYFEPSARGEHGAFDLGAVAYDAGVAHQLLDFGGPVARDLFRHKAVEGASEIFTLAQDGDPRQFVLKDVEYEIFV